MKTLFNSKRAILIAAAILSISVSITVFGQDSGKIFVTGQLVDKQNNQAIPYANVVLLSIPDSVLVTGAATNDQGSFTIGPVAERDYCLVISAIGFERISKTVQGNFNTGTIVLNEVTEKLDEVVVAGERIKARSTTGKTTFYINKKLTGISNSVTDILGYIPGIQVDMTKNISVNGEKEIIILVEGKERDKNYLSQLNPDKIDRVEVISSPDSRYDASVKGIINIFLKDKTDSGLSGQVYAEIPTSKQVVYLFPSYNLNYDFKNVSLFTSYNGEFSYFDLLETDKRVSGDGLSGFLSEQELRQKDWSNRFHFGMDYLMNQRNKISLYGFCNPFSRELDGNLQYTFLSGNQSDSLITTGKDDVSKNLSSFYSLFYSHEFKNPDQTFTSEINFYRLSTENGTVFIPENPDDLPDENQNNIVRQYQNSANIRMDFTTPLTGKIRFETGLKAKLQMLADKDLNSFKYNDDIFSAYGVITADFAKNTVRAGVRAEESFSGLESETKNSDFVLLPQLTLNHKFNSKHNIEIVYSTAVTRPTVFDLNPNPSFSNPYSMATGNPELQNEIRQNLSVSYSMNFGDSFISPSLYCKVRKNAINPITFINEEGYFQTTPFNPGNVFEYGFQFSGTIKVFKSIMVNPFFKTFVTQTRVNETGKDLNLTSRKEAGVETGLSAIASLKHDFTVSFQFQFNSPKIDLQNRYYSDPLWFLSLEKSVGKNLKLGVTSAIPLTKTFTYHGNKIESEQLKAFSEGRLELPVVPLFFKIRYQFNSGKRDGRRNQSREDIIEMPEKGFN